MGVKQQRVKKVLEIYLILTEGDLKVVWPQMNKEGLGSCAFCLKCVKRNAQKFLSPFTVRNASRTDYCLQQKIYKFSLGSITTDRNERN